MPFEDLTPLSVGDTAPDFELGDQFGQRFRLSDAVRERPVVIAFVPAAFTGTCTGEFCELRDNLAIFGDASTTLVGISCDPTPALRLWGENEGYEFPLLSDFWPHGEVASAFGVLLPERGIATRATFLVDATMTIRAAFVNPPGEARPISAYREALAAL